MVFLLRTQKALQTQAAEQGTHVAIAPKRPLDSESFDTMVLVFRQNTVLSKFKLLNYTEAALSPLNLPRPVVENIQVFLNNDSSLLQTFVHRLSNESQGAFKEDFSKKSGLQLKFFAHGSSYFPDSFTRYINKQSNNAIVLKVLKREFPADFALFLYPENEVLKNIVSNKNLNRLSSYSLFTKSFQEKFHIKFGELTYSWHQEAKQLQIRSWFTGWELLTFFYEKDDMSKDLLVVKEIVYGGYPTANEASALDGVLEVCGLKGSIDHVKWAHHRVYDAEARLLGDSTRSQ